MCNILEKLFGTKSEPVVSMPTTYSRRFYLGVGINKYPGAPLNGCVNDIEDLSNYLMQYKRFLKGDNMRLLVDERATKNAILERLEWLVSSAGENTICVFQYSGHGTQVPNRNADSEIDGMDEVICPFDFDWQGTWISDDDLCDYADRIKRKGAVPIFIMDACHSGTMLKDMPLFFGGKKSFVSRYYPMPLDIAARITDTIVKRTMASEINENAILISGCQDNQTSADAFISGRYNGALTKSLVSVATRNPNCSWNELAVELPKAVKAAGYTQTPTITGGAGLLSKIIF